MAQLAGFVKILTLFLLKNGVLSQEPTELNDQPKNIVILLAGGGLSYDEGIQECQGVANESLINNPQDAHFMLPLVNMTAHGCITVEEPKENAKGVSIKTLKSMFNGMDPEIGVNASMQRSSFNIIDLAHQEGKATGLVTTLDINSEDLSSIYDVGLKSSNTNCSETDPGTLNLDIILGQAPVASSREEIKKCLFNYDYYTEVNSLPIGLNENVNASSKGNGKKVLGLFSQVGPQDLKKMTSAAIQILRESENGFFLVVTVMGRCNLDTVKMSAEFLEEFLSSDLLNETLVIVTSVDEDVMCCKPLLKKVLLKEDQGNMQTSSALNTDLRNSTATMIPQLKKNNHKKNNQKKEKTQIGKVSPKKALPSTGESSADEKVPVEKMGHGLDNGSAITTESNVAGTRFLPAHTVINESSHKNMLTQHSKGNVEDEKNVLAYPPTESTFVVTERGTEDYDNAFTSSSEAVATSLSWDTSTADSLGGTYSNDELSSITITTVQSTTEGVLVTEKNLNHNVTDGDLGNSTANRKKREATTDRALGIPIHASGPGSRLFRRNINPSELWKATPIGNMLKKFPQLEENARKIDDSSRAMLRETAADDRSSSAFNWNPSAFLGQRSRSYFNPFGLWNHENEATNIDKFLNELSQLKENALKKIEELKAVSSSSLIWSQSNFLGLVIVSVCIMLLCGFCGDI